MPPDPTEARTKLSVRKARIGALVCLLLAASTAARAAPAVVGHGTPRSAIPAKGSLSRFVVRRIVIEGLQRITRGTVLDYLPIEVGTHLDGARIREALRALYRTGFFSSVALRRSGGTLIVRVHERPSIARIVFRGNHSISKKTLQRVLRRAGLVKGRIFNRTVLEEIDHSLYDQYYSHGKYGAIIHAHVRRLPRNRVRILVRIHEGSPARVRTINFVGNKRFSSSTLRGMFKLSTPGLLTWLTGHDRYVRKKLTASLKRVRAFYMDQGYANFHYRSVVVALSPTKRGVYLTMNLHEGHVYRVGRVFLNGRFVVPRARLEKAIRIKRGTIYSRARAKLTADLLKILMQDRGYAFARVETIPQLNRKTHVVSLDFFLDPGERVYVRRIIFRGIHGTDEVVYRRAMLQLEGGWLSPTLVRLSKFQIRRISFVKAVHITTVPVPGTQNRVDLVVHVVQRREGDANVSLGYAQGYGFIVGGQIGLGNFRDQGDLLSLNAQRSVYQTSYSLNYTNPYYTLNGVGQNLSFFYTRSTSFVSYTQAFNTRTYGLTLNYSFPLSTYASYTLGATVTHTNFLTNCSSPPIYFTFALNPNNGSTYTEQAQCSTPDGTTVNVALPGITYNDVAVNLGLSYDTRNRVILASRGGLQAFNSSFGVPPGAQYYYTLTYNSTDYLPLFAGLTYEFNGEVGVGNGYGKTTSLPPLLNFFAGGPYSVRGYQTDSLGPKTVNGIPVGGSMLFYGQNAILLPQLFGHHYPGEAPDYRVALFVDAGNVFAQPGDFRINDLRYSAGIGVTWLTPLGAIRLSWAKPLNPKPQDILSYFQFTLASYY